MYIRSEKTYMYNSFVGEEKGRMKTEMNVLPKTRSVCDLSKLILTLEKNTVSKK